MFVDDRLSVCVVFTTGGQRGAVLQGHPLLSGVQTVVTERPAHRPLSKTGPHTRRQLLQQGPGPLLPLVNKSQSVRWYLITSE